MSAKNPQNYTNKAADMQKMRAEEIRRNLAKAAELARIAEAAKRAEAARRMTNGNK